ncbi:MAG: hypothetical protein M3Y87_12915 [Myxococcota bacterium]|nr:hypothetical protein [Myxococcota bacterium]
MPSWRRFVPIAPFRIGTVGALVDVERRRTLVLSIGAVVRGEPSYLYGYCGPGCRATVSLFALTPRGEQLVSRTIVSEAGGIRVELTSEGARFQDDDQEWHHVRPEAGAASGGSAGASPSARRATLRPGADGVVVELARPEGLRIRGRVLHHPAGTVDLGHAPDERSTIDVSPDGSVAVVATTTYHSCAEEDAPHCASYTFVVERADLRSGAVALLGSGPGRAAARFTRDGSLYVQTTEGLRRWLPGAATEPDTLPAGLRIEVWW